MEYIPYSMICQGISIDMTRKIQNNFYDRFLAIKPNELSEAEWFLKFGWHDNKMHSRRSVWQRIEFPDAETIIKIHLCHPLTAEEIVFLQYGAEIEVIKIPIAIAKGEQRKITGRKRVVGQGED